MTGEELVENLGTIAHSGSKSFVEAIKAAKGNLSEGLIGQFGVGFTACSWSPTASTSTPRAGTARGTIGAATARKISK